MRKLVEFVVLLSAMAVMQIIGPMSALAAPANNGYRLSPVRTDLTITPGATQTVTVFIQNASSAVEHIQVVVDDFQAPTNETGYPALLLNGATAAQHSLKQFTTIPNSTFTLQPNEQKSVAVLVRVPANATSGGYYGAIRFAPLGSTGSKNVNLSASIASLVLITIPGNLVENLSIAGFGVSQGSGNQTHSFFLSNKKLQAVVRFQNSGNVQEQPFGNIILKHGSKTLTTSAVNKTSLPGNVLPGSIRLFNVKLDKVGWFGKYKIEGDFGYGSKGQLLTAQANFYVIPILVIVLVIIALLALLFLIFGLPRVIRAYNRRVITRANRRQ